MPTNGRSNRVRVAADPRASESAPRLELSLQLGSRIRAWPVSRARLRRWVQSALTTDASLTLRLVARAEASALNRAFRQRDYAPNVLTFAYSSADSGVHGGHTLAWHCTADIVLCLPVLREEARRQRKRLEDHLAHLVIHGVLHAQGHDHQRAAEARRMEALEVALLARLGVSDPYREGTRLPD